MGGNIVRRLMRAGHSCVGFDADQAAVARLTREGAIGAISAIEQPDLLADPRFVDTKTRHAQSSALVTELDRILCAKPLAYWKPRLDAAWLPYGIVQIPAEIVNDPQLLANQIIVPINDGSASPKYTVDSPMTIKETPKVPPGAASGLGEHTDQVLREIGFTTDQIGALRASGAIPAVNRARG
ncbi:MAG: CoA transferase [Steroidobacteraceae bacterium]